MPCRSGLETESSQEDMLIYFSSTDLAISTSPGAFPASLEGLRADMR